VTVNLLSHTPMSYAEGLLAGRDVDETHNVQKVTNL